MNFSTSTSLEQIAKFNELLIQLDLVNKVAAWNLGYLALALTILFTAGGFAYIFSVKPIEKRISNSENELQKMEQEYRDLVTLSEGSLENLRSELREEIKNRTSVLEKYIHTLEIEKAFEHHYFWQGATIDFPTLITADLNQLSKVLFLNRIRNLDINIKNTLNQILWTLARPTLLQVPSQERVFSLLSLREEVLLILSVEYIESKEQILQKITELIVDVPNQNQSTLPIPDSAN